MENSFEEAPQEQKEFEDSISHDSVSISSSNQEACSDTSSINSENSSPSIYLKDYGNMGHLINLLPSRAQRGLSSFPLQINSIDAVGEYILVGCNIETLFLYSRKMSGLQRLRCENSKMDNITSVKMISSVELMIAAGSSKGAVVIFMVPTLHSADTHMQRFAVKQLHNRPITCLHWSQNAMKLFSGDSSGLVVCTNIVYENHGCYSNEILREDSAIVQLDYYQQMLLVSTMSRAFVYHSNEENQIKQIGVKPRKSLGRYGAQFSVSDDIFQNKFETNVFTTRPGLRLWKANASGVVIETILFKDAFLQDTYFSGILGSSASARDTSQSDQQQFGQVLIYKKKYVAIYSDDYVFIADPTNRSIISSFRSTSNILTVCVNDDEIFVLQKGPLLIRLASQPDSFGQPVEKNTKPDFAAVQTGLIDIGNRISKSQSNILKKLKNVNIPVSSDQIKMAVDFTKVKDISFPTIPLPKPTSLEPKIENDKPEIAMEALETASNVIDKSNKLAEPISSRIKDIKIKVNSPGGGDVVYKPKKHKKKRSNTNLNIPTISDVESSDMDLSRNVSDSGDNDTLSVTSASDEKFNASDELPTPIKIPSQEQRDELLAQLLTIETCTSPDLEPQDINPKIENILTDDFSNVKEKVEEEAEAEVSQNFQQINISEPSVPIYSDAPDSPDTSLIEDQPDGPAPSSNTANVEPTADITSPSMKPASLDVDSTESQWEEDEEEFDQFSELVPTAYLETKYCDHWMLHETPGNICNISISDAYIVCVTNRDKVYYSMLSEPGLVWQHVDYYANQLVVSRSGAHIWRLYNGIVYAAKAYESNTLKPTVSSWVEMLKSVSWVAIDDDSAWFIKMSGSVYMIQNINESKHFAESVRCSDLKLKLKQIVCYNGVVWGLTTENKIVYRSAISDHCPQGTDWKYVRSRINHNFIAISLCVNQTAWAVDTCGSLWFKTGVTPNFPNGVENDWWEVGVTSYIYKDLSSFDSIKAAVGHINPEKLINVLQPRQLNVNIASGGNGVWFCSNETKELWGNNSYIIGHKMDPFHLINSTANAQWKLVAAESVFENQGMLWLQQSTGELFYIHLLSSKLHQISLPSQNMSIKCLASSSHALWALCSNGKIWILPYHKQTNVNIGMWEKLPLHQIGDVELKHLSLSHDVVWACDKLGNVYMRIGALTPPSTASLAPAWIPVETTTKETYSMTRSLTQQWKAKPHIQFTNVYVGSNNCFVWAIDSKHNVYVREGITENFNVGTHWTYVGGIQAKSLSISNMAVWAIATNGFLYRRFAITDSNPLGDYWKQVPGKLDVISLSADDELWGISSNGSLCQHSAFKLQFEGRGRTKSATKTQMSIDDGEWEVV